MKKITKIWIAATLLGVSACHNQSTKKGNSVSNKATVTLDEIPAFNADSAYRYIAMQCEFGPRVPNSEAHTLCFDYMVDQFTQFGAKIIKQETLIEAWDGNKLNCKNLIASFAPEKERRVLLCAHWDSRPWADNDANPDNWHTPVLGANDGASGVGIMLEIARQIESKAPQVGVDFICFDVEDYGIPAWSTQRSDEDGWCYGSQYWAENMHITDYRPLYGILLDMVGGRGATFFREGFSLRYASPVVEKVWNAAAQLGYGSYFPKRNGGYITDDHLPINQIANIPCIDIIPYHEHCRESSFGPTWHTVNDDMKNIDKKVLKAVGQTVMEVLYTQE